MGEQPALVIVPATVAVVWVMALTAPLVTTGASFTPDPEAATFTAVETPPPATGILPL